MEDTRKTWSMESTKPGLHGLTETETADLGPAWVCTKSLRVCYGCLVSVFVGLITVEAAVSLSICLLLGCLVQPLYRGFCPALPYCVLFCPVWFLSLGGLLFSEEVEEEWIWKRERRWREGWEELRDSDWDVLYERRISFQ